MAKRGQGIEFMRTPGLGPEPQAPATSWWLEAESREAFTRAAQREQLRMRLSRFGSWRLHYPEETER